jgi:TPR repeat protein
LEAAQLGHPRAQVTLGNIYWNGYANQPQDYRKAAYWYSLAAAQGHRSAEFNLAGIYTEGLGGMPVDLRRAAELLIDSSRQGYAPAQEALGISYEFGEGLQRNRRSAVYWLQQAAAQGDQTASQLATFLNRPNTPVFQSEAQFANYMAAQMSNQRGAGHGCVPNLNWSPTGHTGVGPIVYCH